MRDEELNELLNELGYYSVRKDRDDFGMEYSIYKIKDDDYNVEVRVYRSGKVELNVIDEVDIDNISFESVYFRDKIESSLRVCKKILDRINDKLNH